MRPLSTALFLLSLASLSGCASLVSSATNRMAGNLSHAILSQDDPQTVRDGAPAYLLLIDSFVEGDPENTPMLMAGAQLYGAYASIFVNDPARSQRLAHRAKTYAERGLCLEMQDICAAVGQPFPVFQATLATAEQDDVPVLYSYATAWAGWVQSNRGDWNAVADLPKIQALLERIVALDEAYDGGGAHVYLGVLATLLPPAVGGRPEEGRAHFEKAIAIAQGKNLMTKVLFAERYARLVFDRELHDRLLQDVLAADAEAPGLTLINTLAQQQAQTLLASADDYF